MIQPFIELQKGEGREGVEFLKCGWVCYYSRFKI